MNHLQKVYTGTRIWLWNGRKGKWYTQGEPTLIEKLELILIVMIDHSDSNEEDQDKTLMMMRQIVTRMKQLE